MRRTRTLPAYTLLALGAALAPAARAAVECQADVRATVKSDQVTDEAIIKVFAVEIDTREDCAKVYVDFIVTERLFNGEEITSTRRGWRKVSNQAVTYRGEYRIARDTTLVDWKFKVARCVVCGTE